MDKGSGVSAPGAIEELSNNLVAYVEKAMGFTPDFTPETLPIVDHYISQVRSDALGRPELSTLLGQVVGAYFGQVLCKGLGGFWRLPSQNIVDWQFCASRALLWLNPIGVAYDALHQTAEHEGPSSTLRVSHEERELVRARLMSLPAVDEKDYFLLSTRYEAIEFALDALVARLAESGYEDMVFTEEDYEGELRPFVPL